MSSDLYMTRKKRMKQKNSETIELLLAKSEAGKLFQMFFFSRKLTIWEIFFTSFSEIQPSLLHAQHFLAFRIILPLLLLKLMTQIFWVSLWIFVFWGLTNSPPSDVKVNLGRNPWIMVNFWVLKGQLWVLTCIPAVHFSAISVNFSRGWLFLMYRNSRLHPLYFLGKPSKKKNRIFHDIEQNSFATYPPYLIMT